MAGIPLLVSVLIHVFSATQVSSEIIVPICMPPMAYIGLALPLWTIYHVATCSVVVVVYVYAYWSAKSMGICRNFCNQK